MCPLLHLYSVINKSCFNVFLNQWKDARSTQTYTTTLNYKCEWGPHYMCSRPRCCQTPPSQVTLQQVSLLLYVYKDWLTQLSSQVTLTAAPLPRLLTLTPTGTASVHTQLQFIWHHHLTVDLEQAVLSLSLTNPTTVLLVVALHSHTLRLEDSGPLRLNHCWLQTQPNNTSMKHQKDRTPILILHSEVGTDAREGAGAVHGMRQQEQCTMW